jgi:hypothetical protein
MSKLLWKTNRTKSSLFSLFFFSLIIAVRDFVSKFSIHFYYSRIVQTNGGGHNNAGQSSMSSGRGRRIISFIALWQTTLILQKATTFHTSNFHNFNSNLLKPALRPNNYFTTSILDATKIKTF